MRLVILSAATQNAFPLPLRIDSSNRQYKENGRTLWTYQGRCRSVRCDSRTSRTTAQRFVRHLSDIDKVLSSPRRGRMGRSISTAWSSRGLEGGNILKLAPNGGQKRNLERMLERVEAGPLDQPDVSCKRQCLQMGYGKPDEAKESAGSDKATILDRVSGLVPQPQHLLHLLPSPSGNYSYKLKHIYN